MYTIIRFTAPKEDVSSLEKIGMAMNEHQAGAYTGLRRAGDGFACELSSSSRWQDHQQKIVGFVDSFSQFIQEAHDAGASITVDVAVEPEDLTKGTHVLRLDDLFLARLSDHHVALELSFY
jgi:hypothetical protein